MPSQNDDINRSPIEVWQVENLRLTAFPIPLEQDTESWWVDVVGELPESSTSQPKRGVKQQKSLIETDIELTLNVQPSRIDWLLSLAEDQDTPPTSFPLIGPFPDLLDRFSIFMYRWFELETCPSLHRLAFGAVLLHPVGSRTEGYRLLNSYLPTVSLDPENTFDFSYQINRPRESTSGIVNFSVNRLSKWGVSTWRSFALSIEPITRIRSFPDQELYACRLQLDINTSQYFQGEITREHLPEVFSELVELGVEIIREGDIP